MTITLEDAVQKNRLAMRLENGAGIPMNQEEARKLYIEAAEAGWAAAQNNLGYRLYYAQCGFSLDKKQALEWYKKSAAQEYASAAVNLFKHYRATGDALAEHYAKEAKRLGRTDADDWLNRLNAADPDKSALEIKFSQDAYLADSLFREGMMDMHGQNGHAKNPEAAVENFRQAAQRGNPKAAFELGQCYRFGRGVGRDLHQALVHLQEAESKEVPGAAESMEKVKGHLGSSPPVQVLGSSPPVQVLGSSPPVQVLGSSPPVQVLGSSQTIQNESQFKESIKAILNDSNRESRNTQWRELASSYSTERTTVADGRKAFHIGALALAGCSNLDGRRDVFNALYWFQLSTESKFVWGHLGQALIDQKSDRKFIAQGLLSELDRPFNIEELLLHKDAFFSHIQEHCLGLDYISSLVILFGSDQNAEVLRLQRDWFDFVNDPQPKVQPDQLSDRERTLLFAGVLFERLRPKGELAESELEYSRTNLYTARKFIAGLKQTDDFSASINSAINASLVEIERLSQDVIRREVEGRIIALQSHTLKGPLGNALRILDDIKRWNEREDYDHINPGLNSMESNLRIIRNLVEANDLFLFDQAQFGESWSQDSVQGDVRLAQVICEAAQQAILRLNAKEFRLERTGRKLLRKDVSQASTSISMVDFADVENVSTTRNGFEYPFQFVKIEFDTGVMEFYIGADGIRRQFYFAMAHELIFNAIKYDSGAADIRISLRIEEGRMVFTCQNDCVSEAERNSLHTSNRGHGFLKEVLAKMTDSSFEIHSSPTAYLAKIVLGTAWSAK